MSRVPAELLLRRVRLEKVQREREVSPHTRRRGLVDHVLEAVEGQSLATQGDFGYALYAVESGTAEVSANGSLLRTLGPGDVFGEIAVIASGRRTASVAATSPMRLIVLFNRDVWALEQQAPEAAARLRALVAERQAVEPT